MSDHGDGDGVSALSGIGNDLLEDKRKWRGRMGSFGGRKGNDVNQRSSQQNVKPNRSSGRNPIPETVRSQSKGKSNPRSQENSPEQTQQELDAFIAKNDWGSVSKYINDMRTSNKSNSTSSVPKSKFGAQSQM